MIGLPDHHLGERAAALVDGELGPESRDLALAHVARCDDCRAEVAAQRRLKARLHQLGDPGAPGGLAERLREIADRADAATALGPLGDPLSDTIPLMSAFGGLPLDRADPRQPSLPPGGLTIGAAALHGPGARGPLRSRRRRLHPPARRDRRAPGRRARRPVRFAVAGGVGILALGISAFMAGGESAGPRVVPNVQQLSVEHANTSGEVPFELPMPGPQLVDFHAATSP